MSKKQAQQYLLSLVPSKQTFHKIGKDVKSSKSKIIEYIEQGMVNVKEIPQQLNHKLVHIDNLIKDKKILLKTQLDGLAKQQHQHSIKYQNIKRQLIQLKKQQQLTNKLTQQEKKKQVQQTVKKWKQQQKQIQIRKKSNQEKKKQLEFQKSQKQIKQQQQMIKFNKAEKRKVAEMKMKQIQQARAKRVQIIKSSQIVSKSIPKYLEIEKKFNQQQYQKDFEEEITKKNKKLQMMVSLQSIKAHQKQYLQQVKARKLTLQKLMSKSKIDEKRQQFNVLYNRNQQQIKEELQKLQRRRKFQQIIKQIPIQIDQAKKVQIQIAKDRGKNPLKYNFLSQKALNQFQIYGQFQQFAINSNSRELGKQYLKQLRSLPKISRVTKSQSLKSLNQPNKSDRPTYTNYLEKLKQIRPHRIQNQQEDIEEIVKKYKNQNQLKQILMKKSQNYQAQALKKLTQLKNTMGYKETLKKSSQADSMLLKAVKSKLAYLEIKN